jgi:hypothetical protein
MVGDECRECQRLLGQYSELIERMHDLRNHAGDVVLLEDKIRLRVFVETLTDLERRTDAAKQQLAAHQQTAHARSQ